MAQCITFDASGFAVQSAADPCTTAVVLTPAEYGALAANPLNLSLEDGALLGGAIVGIWAAAFAFRAAIRALNADDVSEEVT